MCVDNFAGMNEFEYGLGTVGIHSCTQSGSRSNSAFREILVLTKGYVAVGIGLCLGLRLELGTGRLALPVKVSLLQSPTRIGDSRRKLETKQRGGPVTRTSCNETTSNIDVIDGPRIGPSNGLTVGSTRAWVTGSDG